MTQNDKIEEDISGDSQEDNPLALKSQCHISGGSSHTDPDMINLLSQHNQQRIMASQQMIENSIKDFEK